MLLVYSCRPIEINPDKKLYRSIVIVYQLPLRLPQSRLELVRRPSLHRSS